MGVNTWEGTEWLDRDRFAALLAWAERLDALEGHAATGLAERLTAAAEAAGYRLDRLREPFTAKPVPARPPQATKPKAKAPESRKGRKPPS